MIVVVSTGLAASTREKCMTSVDMQVGADFRHVYVEASNQHPPHAQMRNFFDAVHLLDPQDIVVALDGDDWFPHNGVLSKVQEMHDDGAWVTYGNFEMADGRESGQVEVKPPFRGQWMSHLKTYRAGLFQRVPKEYWMVDGEWNLVQDVAAMWAVSEMAGPDRVKWCPDVLYVYNIANSFEWTATPAQKQKQRDHLRHYKSLAPFARVEAL